MAFPVIRTDPTGSILVQMNKRIDDLKDHLLGNLQGTGPDPPMSISGMWTNWNGSLILTPIGAPPLLLAEHPSPSTVKLYQKTTVNTTPNMFLAVGTEDSLDSICPPADIFRPIIINANGTDMVATLGVSAGGIISIKNVNGTPFSLSTLLAIPVTIYPWMVEYGVDVAVN